MMSPAFSQSGISVVIPCRDAAATLPRQLKALAEQAGPPAFEVVIVDNGSTDDLAGASRGYEDRLKLRIVDASGRAGVCHARNVGVLAAHGKYVLICDADDVVDAGWVAAMTRVLRKPGGLVAGTLRYGRINPDWVVKAMGLSSGLWLPAPYLGYLPFAYGCAMGIARTDYLLIGGMDESIVGGSDDVEFSWRAQETGLEFRFAEDAIVDYALRAEPRSVFAQRRSYQRGDVLVWSRSIVAGRPVDGKSMRWSLNEALKLPGEYLRLQHADPATQLAWATRAGGVLGSCEGHQRYRLCRRDPGPHLLTQVETESGETCARTPDPMQTPTSATLLRTDPRQA